MWGKSSRGALGGAVKQLAFDSTALVKTNMADGEGGGGGVSDITLGLEEVYRPGISI